MTFKIQNMKCSGCSTSIKEKLSKIEGVENVEADLQEDSITFEYTHPEVIAQVREILRKMGYPLSDTENTIGNITKSYLNCMVGKVKNAV